MSHSLSRAVKIYIVNNKTKEKIKMEELILKSIEEIKPFLQRDGGDIEFVELTPDNIVRVRLQGACHGCPGAQLTLQSIVERIVREAVPEVAGIEAV